MSDTDKSTLDWGKIDLYRFFAFILGTPSQAKFTWLGQSVTSLAALWKVLGMEGEAPPLKQFPDCREYEAGYISLFDVGVTGPPVPLVESFHRKEIPPPQTVLENMDFYEVIGLRPDKSVTAPDHLITQLEFLSSVRYLQENSKDEAQCKNLRQLERDFLERHLLCWIPAAKAKIEALGPPLFPMIFALLLRFLQVRHGVLKA